jgi:hypothetical protein
MVPELNPHNRTVSNHLPSIVYKAAAGCVLLFVVLAWIFFGDWAHMGLVLAVVSVFFFMTLAIPFALWLTWRRHQDSEAAQAEAISLREWASREFATCQDHLKGRDAAAEILLPIVATAVGMLAIGTVFFVVSVGAG